MTFAVTGDTATSEDVAQEAFLAAWRSLATLRDPARFRAWVCGIARNLGLNALRSRGRRSTEADDLDALPDDDDLEGLFDERESAALVWRALERIPPKYREALVLFYREGRSAREVAAALEISVSAVEQRLSRGRKHLERRVERLVERSLRDSEPRGGFAAAVVAAIPTATLPSTEPSTEPAAASPAEGSRFTQGTIRTMTLIAIPAALALAAAAAFVPSWLVGEDGVLASGPRGTEDDTDVDDHGPDATAAAAASVGPSSGADPVAAQTATEDPRVESNRRARERARREEEADSGAGASKPLRLTTVRGDSYAVKLDGGASRATMRPLPPGQSHPAPPPVIRHLRGVVLDAHGKPVADAIVIANDGMLKISRGDMRGSAADTTAADGSFSLELRSADPYSVLALHRSGWSKLNMVPAGQDDHRLTFALETPGRVKGTLRRGGEGTLGSLQLTTKGKGRGEDSARLLTFVRSTEDGSYASPPLPPDLYYAYAQAGHSAGEGGARTKVDGIVVEAGTATTQDIDLPVGAKVELLVDVGPVSGRFLVAELLVGHHTVRSREDFDHAQRTATSGGSGRTVLMRGTFQKDDPWVFEDVAAGRFTACLYSSEGTPLKPTAMACAQLTVEPQADYTSVKMPALVALP